MANAADDVETEQSFGDDREASNMAASCNGSIADHSPGNSDDDHAAMIESLDLNLLAEGISLTTSVSSKNKTKSDRSKGQHASQWPETILISSPFKS